jgi:cystathionine gamma-synthase
MNDESSPKTRAVRAALDTDTQFGAVVPPIHLTSTFSFAAFGEKRAYDYSRSGNPTRDALAGALADLEGGAGAVVTGSGMAAVGLVTQLFRPGQVAVVPHDCYGGTYRLFNALGERGSLDVRFTNFQDGKALAAALEERPALVWIETPSNPLLRIVDVAGVARAALALGADVVLHSTTKYLNGHSDVVGGAVVAADRELHERLAWWANCIGVTGAAFDSYLTLRGLRTLHARMRAHGENATEVARMLDGHPVVAKVHYPGLESHPGHALARAQQQGFGAMVSFELRGGLEQVRRFLDSLEYFSLAESLGGVESLVAHPASMTHAAMDAAARERAGISDTLVRLSVGIEDTADLLRDLAGALDAAHGSGA